MAKGSNIYKKLFNKLTTGKSMVIPEFLNMVVFTAPLLVSGDGCSLFLKFDQEDDKIILSATTRTHLKKFVGHAYYSTEKEKYRAVEELNDNIKQNENGILDIEEEKKIKYNLKQVNCGLTGWVAAFDRTLNLKNLRNIKERKEYVELLNLSSEGEIPLPLWADLYRGFGDSLEKERPFLCVPVHATIEKTRRTIGALRIATKRDAASPTFKDFERENLEEFADIVGQVLTEQRILNKESLHLLCIYASQDKDTLLSEIAKMVTAVLIEESSCSIFLRDENDLFQLREVKAAEGVIEYNQYIEDFKAGKSISYKSGEGKTGKVIEERSFLKVFLDKEGNMWDRKNGELLAKNEEIKMHDSTKPCELPHNLEKWFCVVPILSLDNATFVKGVIRVVCKNEIEDEQVKLLDSFTSHIAKVLTEIEQKEDITQLFNKIVGTLGNAKNVEEEVLKAAIELIEADAATIFRESKPEPAQDKTFEKTATVSGFKQRESPQDYRHFQIFKNNQVKYSISKSNRSVGKTGYALVTGKTFSIDNSSDESQLPDDFKKFSGTSFLSCELQNLGAMLIVPISDYQENGQSKVNGAIRFVRLKDSPRGGFNRNDMAIAKLLAQNLSLILNIHDIREKKQKETEKIKEAKEKWKSTLESIFSRQLIKALKKIYDSESSFIKSKASPVIKNFLDFYADSSSFTIVKTVEDTIFDLWEAFEMKNQKLNEISYSTLFEYFRKYESVLYDLPHYRDHFVHQLVIYLLGQAIIDSLELNEIDPKAWLIASTFHDIAYPIAKASSVYTRVVEVCFKSELTRDQRFDLQKLMYGETTLVIELDLITQWIISELGFSEEIRKREEIKIFLFEKLFREYDHGLLSALTLLRHIEPSQKDDLFIKDAAIGIALHNIAVQLYRITQKRYTFQKTPTLLLLLFCDALHEWGRSKSSIEQENSIDRICLNKFDVVKNRGDAYIDASVEILADDKRRNEIFSSIKDLFETIESINPIFNLKIKNYGKKGEFSTNPKIRFEESRSLEGLQELSSLSKDESVLLLKINQGVPPDTQKRYDELIDKRQSETLTPEEYDELLRLTDQIEKLDAKRVEYLKELARIRQTSLNTVMEELDIQTPAYD